MKINIISEFKKKSKAFKITAAVAAVVIVVLWIYYFLGLENVPAEYIKLSAEEIYLEPQMTYKLNPQIKPYNTTQENIAFKVSDESIVKVSGYNVIPVGTGSTHIYCYDKTTGMKSNPVKVNVVKSITKLIPKTKGDNEDELPTEKTDEPRYVYFTANGSKYHTENCSSLGKKPYKTVLNNAINNGLTPCRRCMPYIDTE